jgi:hypothetical protein
LILRHTPSSSRSDGKYLACRWRGTLCLPIWNGRTAR